MLKKVDDAMKYTGILRFSIKKEITKSEKKEFFDQKAEKGQGYVLNSDLYPFPMCRHKSVQNEHNGSTRE